MTSLDQILRILPTCEEVLCDVSLTVPELLLDLQVPATTLGMDVVHAALADSWASLEIVLCNSAGGTGSRWRWLRWRPTSSSTPTPGITPELDARLHRTFSTHFRKTL